MQQHRLTQIQFNTLIRPHREQLLVAQENLERNIRYLLAEAGLTGANCHLSADGRSLLVEEVDPDGRPDLGASAPVNGHVSDRPGQHGAERNPSAPVDGPGSSSS